VASARISGPERPTRARDCYVEGAATTQGMSISSIRPRTLGASDVVFMTLSAPLRWKLHSHTVRGTDRQLILGNPLSTVFPRLDERNPG
jgi:hypothetical protein